MPTAFDPKTVCDLALALIIGSLVGMERETGKALSGNVGIGVGAVSASVSQTLGNA